MMSSKEAAEAEIREAAEAGIQKTAEAEIRKAAEAEIRKAAEVEIQETAEAEIRKAAGILVGILKNEITPQQNIQMPDETAEQIQREEDEIALRRPVDEISMQIKGDRILSPEEMNLLEQLRDSLPELDFPHTLYELLCSPDLLNDRIRWSPEGDAFQIVSKEGLEKYGLKLLCKGVFTSLERKLQAYGFKRTGNQQYQEYTHKKRYFLKAQKQKLKKIRRKPSKARAVGAATLAEGMEDHWVGVEGRQLLLEQRSDAYFKIVDALQVKVVALEAENVACRAEVVALQKQLGMA